MESTHDDEDYFVWLQQQSPIKKINRLLSHEQSRISSTREFEKDNVTEELSDNESDSSSGTSFYSANEYLHYSTSSDDEDIWYLFEDDGRPRKLSKRQKKHRKQKDRPEWTLQQSNQDFHFTSVDQLQDSTVINKILCTRDATSGHYQPLSLLELTMKFLCTKQENFATKNNIPNNLKDKLKQEKLTKKLNQSCLKWCFSALKRLEDITLCHNNEFKLQTKLVATKARRRVYLSKNFSICHRNLYGLQNVKCFHSNAQTGTNVIIPLLRCWNQLENEYITTFSAQLADGTYTNTEEALAQGFSLFVNILNYLLQNSVLPKTVSIQARINRLILFLNKKYPLIISMFAEEAIPYVLWGKGFVDEACAEFIKLSKKKSLSDQVAIFNEIGRMYAMFDMKSDSQTFYKMAFKICNDLSSSKLATEFDLDEQDKWLIKWKILNQQYALSASVEDEGFFNLESNNRAYDAWMLLFKDGPVPTPQTDEEKINIPLFFERPNLSLQIRSIVSLVFCHSNNESEWIQKVLSQLNSLQELTCMTTFYRSFLHAVLGQQKMAIDLLRVTIMQYRTIDADLFGIQEGVEVSVKAAQLWGPLFDQLAYYGTAPQAMKMIWRKTLSAQMCAMCLDNYKSYCWFVGDNCSEKLDLRLTEEGFLSGNMQVICPSINNVCLNPKTGRVNVNEQKIPEWNETVPLNDNKVSLINTDNPRLLEIQVSDNCFVKVIHSGIGSNNDYLDYVLIYQKNQFWEFHFHKFIRKQLLLFELAKTERVVDELLPKQKAHNFVPSDEEMDKETIVAKVHNMLRRNYVRNLNMDASRSAAAAIDIIAKIIEQKKRIETEKNCKKKKFLKKKHGEQTWTEFFILMDYSVNINSVVLHFKQCRNDRCWSDELQVWSNVHVTIRFSAKEAKPDISLKFAKVFHYCSIENTTNKRSNFFFKNEKKTFEQSTFIVKMPQVQQTSGLHSCHFFTTHEMNESLEQKSILFQDYFTYRSRNRQADNMWEVGNLGDYNLVCVKDAIYCVEGLNFKKEQDMTRLQSYHIVDDIRLAEGVSFVQPGIQWLDHIGETLVVFLKDRIVFISTPDLKEIVLHNENNVVELTDDTGALNGIKILQPLQMHDVDEDGEAENVCSVMDTQPFTDHFSNKGYRAAVVLRGQVFIIDVMNNSLDASVVAKINCAIQIPGQVTEIKIISGIGILVCGDVFGCSKSNFQQHILYFFSFNGQLLSFLLGLGGGPHNFFVYAPDLENQETGHENVMIYFRDGYGAICCAQLLPINNI